MYLKLKKNYEFARVFNKGLRANSKYLSINWFHKKNNKSLRLGVTVSRNSYCAVERNRLKRLLREVFRHSAISSLESYDIILIARASKSKITYANLQKDLDYLYTKFILKEKNKNYIINNTVHDDVLN